MLSIGSLVKEVPALLHHHSTRATAPRPSSLGLIIAEEKGHSAFFPGEGPADATDGLHRLWTVLWPDGSLCNDWGYSLLEVEQEA